MIYFALFILALLTSIISYYIFDLMQKLTITDFPDSKWGWNSIWNLLQVLTKAIPPASMSSSSYVYQCLLGACKIFEGDGIFSIRRGVTNILIICSPERAAEVLNEKHLIAKSNTYYFGLLAMGNGLAMTRSNDYWKLHRRMVSPSFSQKGAVSFISYMNHHSKLLLHKIQEKIDSEVDITNLTSCCTFNILIELSALRTNRVSETWMIASLNPVVYNKYWLKFAPNGIKIMDKITKITNTFRETIREMKKRSEDESDEPNVTFINQVFEKLKSSDKNFSFEDIVTETITLSTGAYETIVFGTNWTLQLLGEHKDVQKKIQKELDDVLGEDYKGDITVEHLNKMSYLNMVCQESLRLYPPTPVIGRLLERDTMIAGRNIPKGTDILVFISAVHRNSAHWKNPDAFIPERFATIESENRHPFSYIPFSAGPRNCLGGAFALYEIKIIIASIIRKYDFTAVRSLDQYHVKWRLVGGPSKNILLKFKPREFAS